MRAILIVILLVVCFFQIRALFYDLTPLKAHNGQYEDNGYGALMRGPDSILPSEIQPWMTFGYIDFVFRLPPGYLENALHISAKQYPNIQIAHYARMNHLVLTQFLSGIQQAVAQYHP